MGWESTLSGGLTAAWRGLPAAGAPECGGAAGCPPPVPGSITPG